MAAAPYILAGDFKEGHDFAQDVLGLPKGHYYLVTSVKTIRGPRNADLHIVPGWQKRADRFVIESGLRYTGLNVIDHTQEPEAPTLDDLQLDLIDATDFFEPIPTVVAPEVTEALETAPTKKRRSKCKVCQTMITPEERESGTHDHTQDLVSVSS